jgi:hypothetical protein
MSRILKLIILGIFRIFLKGSWIGGNPEWLTHKIVEMCHFNKAALMEAAKDQSNLPLPLTETNPECK